MLQNTNNQISVKDTLLNFAEKLNAKERDALKYRMSLSSILELENTFDLNKDLERLNKFYELLDCINLIQPFNERVPKYGIVYKGRPPFITDEVLISLQNESANFRKDAKINLNQLIYQIDERDESTVCEKLEASDEIIKLVTTHAGSVLPSYVSSYIYYDEPGQCSKPHVDNSFTAITAMICLSHDFIDKENTSLGVFYWPNSPRYEYCLIPGEMIIFFGISVLHGRTPIVKGENLSSLLLSFRPN